MSAPETDTSTNVESSTKSRVFEIQHKRQTLGRPNEDQWVAFDVAETFLGAKRTLKFHREEALDRGENPEDYRAVQVDTETVTSRRVVRMD